MKYESVLERRKSPPRMRRMSRRERRLGSSSGSDTEALGLEAEGEGASRSLGGRLARERRVVMMRSRSLLELLSDDHWQLCSIHLWRPELSTQATTQLHLRAKYYVLMSLVFPSALQLV